ncbi:MAG: 50S ribosomal protein L25/general stress protein Ctc [Longimicrobiaceae bacterium]
MATTLKAELRQERGKGEARRMRAGGRIPAVIYGHGDETRALSLDAHEFERLLASLGGESALIDIQVGRKKTPALIREVQWDPVRPVILHVDLYQIHADEKIHLEVAVRVTGNPVGVREEGGVLQHVRHEIEVECLPKDIPEHVEVNADQLAIGDSIHVRDLDLPGVKILTDGELTICSVVPPTVVEVEEPAEAAEPELVGAEEEEAGAAETESEPEEE